MNSWSRLRQYVGQLARSDWFLPVVAALVAVVLGAVLLWALGSSSGQIPFTGTHWG